jgi:hypothetical protein
MSLRRLFGGGGEAALARLAPVIDGAVEKRDLRGSYGGYDVEARLSRHDPTPSHLSGEVAPDEVDVFELRLLGVAGRGAWAFRRQVSSYVFDGSFGGAGPMAGFLGAVADVPDTDPALEERLRSAGVVELVAGLGEGASSFLPHVRFTPAPASRATSAAAAVLPAELLARYGHAGELFVEVELGPEPDPTTLRELLDRSLRIVAANAGANGAD